MGWNLRKRRRKNKDRSSFESRKKIKTIPQTQEDVLVEDVQIIGRRRECDPEKIKTLAASISMVGTPYTNHGEAHREGTRRR